MIDRFLLTYGFDGEKGFALSLFPSFKYGNQAPVITSSIILGAFGQWMGFTPALVLVMFIIILIEMISGIWASKKQGHTFESFKFSRLIIKLFIWVSLFFMFHNFSASMAAKPGLVFSMGVLVFDICTVMTMVFFCIEYATSILENLAVIDGKPKATFINAIGSIFTALINLFKSMIHDNNRD